MKSLLKLFLFFSQKTFIFFIWIILSCLLVYIFVPKDEKTNLALNIKPDNKFETSSQKTAQQSLEFLGKTIFDTKFSSNNQLSCSSCHQEQFGFSDNKTPSVGILNNNISRKTPSLLNTKYYDSFFWDGRIEVLDDAVLQAFTNKFEMGNSSLEEVLRKIENQHYLKDLFKENNLPINKDSLSLVLSQYILGLKEKPNIFVEKNNLSVLDRDRSRDTYDLSQQKFNNGFLAFKNSHCNSCHNEQQHFTDNLFHPSPIKTEILKRGLQKLKLNKNLSIGELIASNPDVSDLGHYLVTQSLQDLGSFRTPSLIGVGNLNSFYHDGRFKTLKEVVDWEIYYRNPNGISFLGTYDKEDLLYFLNKL